MLRKAPLKQSTKSIKRSPIKKRGRSASEKNRVYGSKAFRDWLH